jgi:hypothetical protein
MAKELFLSARTVACARQIPRGNPQKRAVGKAGWKRGYDL